MDKASRIHAYVFIPPFWIKGQLKRELPTRYFQNQLKVIQIAVVFKFHYFRALFLASRYCAMFLTKKLALEGFPASKVYNWEKKDCYGNMAKASILGKSDVLRLSENKKGRTPSEPRENPWGRGSQSGIPTRATWVGS